MMVTITAVLVGVKVGAGGSDGVVFMSISKVLASYVYLRLVYLIFLVLLSLTCF